MSKSSDVDMPDDDEHIQDALAFLRLSRIYSSNSKDLEVQGYYDKLDEAWRLVTTDYKKAYEILTDIYKDELTGVRDREFKFIVRDAIGSMELVLFPDEDDAEVEESESVEAETKSQKVETVKEEPKKETEAKTEPVEAKTEKEIPAV